jgi:hypothetical protein
MRKGGKQQQQRGLWVTTDILMGSQLGAFKGSREGSVLGSQEGIGEGSRVRNFVGKKGRAGVEAGFEKHNT